MKAMVASVEHGRNLKGAFPKTHWQQGSRCNCVPLTSMHLLLGGQQQGPLWLLVLTGKVVERHTF